MSSKVTSMPGEGCRFYKYGHCHYEESLNPGFHKRFRCKLLVAWESDFEDFIARAERFNLDPETAGRIWSEKMKSLRGRADACEDFQQGGGASEIGCLHAYLDVCLLALPLCRGQCTHFQPKLRNRR